MKIRVWLGQYGEQIIILREGAITIIPKMFNNHWPACVIDLISKPISLGFLQARAA